MVSDREPLKIRAAKWAGTVLRVTRRPAVTLLMAWPGLAGAAAITVGAAELVGHIFGRDLTLWTALLIGGAFAVRIGAEINARPPAPRAPDD